MVGIWNGRETGIKDDSKVFGLSTWMDGNVCAET